MSERRTYDPKRDGCANFYHGYTGKFVPKTEFDPKCSACVNRRKKEEACTS